MRFVPTPLSGAYIIEPEPREDERGAFFRSFCEEEFRAQGLDFPVAQCNISENRFKGTLRGMHFQKAPFSEIKLVRCFSGAIFDVAVDARADSATRRQWFGVELTAKNRRALYVPGGFAHGYLTLEDDSSVFYQVSEFYHPEAESGIRWDDPAVGIRWPLAPALISDKDRRWASL
jgi:dTDP-4-dehydrorhamnose 3,5-epimerase